jgi:hypothetical protein
MRILLLAIFASGFFLSSEAQTPPLPVSHLNFTQWQPGLMHDQQATGTSLGRKWYLSKYAGITAGSIFYPGGASFLAVPVGLQLTRPLNANLYAFTGISAAPVIFNFNRLYTDPVKYPYYPGNNFPNGNGFGLNTRIEAGLMYINDAKTFSISGSVGIEKNNYPVYPPNRVPAKKQ